MFSFSSPTSGAIIGMLVVVFALALTHFISINVHAG